MCMLDVSQIDCDVIHDIIHDVDHDVNHDVKRKTVWPNFPCRKTINCSTFLTLKLFRPQIDRNCFRQIVLHNGHCNGGRPKWGIKKPNPFIFLRSVEKRSKKFFNWDLRERWPTKCQTGRFSNIWWQWSVSFACFSLHICCESSRYYFFHLFLFVCRRISVVNFHEVGNAYKALCWNSK